MFVKDEFSYDAIMLNRHKDLLEKIMRDFIKKVIAKEKSKAKIIIYHSFDGFELLLPLKGELKNIEIGYDWADLDLSSVSRRTFRNNIYKRDIAACDFSDITLSLLHEIGHFFTINTLPKDYDMDAQLIDAQNKANTQEELDELYYNIPSEYIATQWAIEWLKKKKNRLIAKQFESLFFNALKDDNKN